MGSVVGYDVADGAVVGACACGPQSSEGEEDGTRVGEALGPTCTIDGSSDGGFGDGGPGFPPSRVGVLDKVVEGVGVGSFVGMYVGFKLG